MAGELDFAHSNRDSHPHPYRNGDPDPDGDCNSNHDADLYCYRFGQAARRRPAVAVSEPKIRGSCPRDQNRGSRVDSHG